MLPKRVLLLLTALLLGGLSSAPAQETAPTITQLEEELRAQDARLKELEAQLAKLKAAQPPSPGEIPSVTTTGTKPAEAQPAAVDAVAPAPGTAPAPEAAPVEQPMPMPAGTA